MPPTSGAIHHRATATTSVVSLSDYLSLMRRFLAGAITAADFQRSYFALSGGDEEFRPERTFRALNDLFFALDDFYEDPALRDPGDLDEAQLRARVEATLAVLAPETAD